MQNANTIVALSTPPGRSGIGVVRLSGEDALAYSRALVGIETLELEPNRASLKTLRDPESQEILRRTVRNTGDYWDREAVVVRLYSYRRRNIQGQWGQ